MAGRAAANDEAAALSQQLAEDREQLDEFASLAGQRLIDTRQWLAAKKPVEERIADVERRLARLTRSDALSGLVGNASALRQQWVSLNLTRQAAIVAAVVERVVVGPGSPGARSLDLSRIDTKWRL